MISRFATTRSQPGKGHCASPPFTVPAEVYALWQATAKRGAAARATWTAALGKAKPKLREEFLRVTSGTLPKALPKAIRAVKASAIANPQEIATRKAGVGHRHRQQLGFGFIAQSLQHDTGGGGGRGDVGPADIREDHLVAAFGMGGACKGKGHRGGQKGGFHFGHVDSLGLALAVFFVD